MLILGTYWPGPHDAVGMTPRLRMRFDPVSDRSSVRMEVRYDASC